MQPQADEQVQCVQQTHYREKNERTEDPNSGATFSAIKRNDFIERGMLGLTWVQPSYICQCENGIIDRFTKY